VSPDDAGFPAARPEPSVDELFATGPSASPQDIRDAAMASMGLGSSPVPRLPPEHPPVHQLSEDLGLT
jgi:hypothetical protein